MGSILSSERAETAKKIIKSVIKLKGGGKKFGVGSSYEYGEEFSGEVEGDVLEAGEVVTVDESAFEDSGGGFGFDFGGFDFGGDFGGGE